MKLLVIVIAIISTMILLIDGAVGDESSTIVTDLDDLDLETSASTNHNNQELAASVIHAILTSELVQHKLTKLYDIIDLKIRFFRLLNSLLTRENFLLLRNVLDLIARTCNFIISFLPEPEPATEHHHGSFISSLFPILTSFHTYPPEEDSAPIPIPTPEIIISSTPSSINNIYPASIGRVDRSVPLTKDERKILEEHSEEVKTLAKLIYNTEQKK